MIIILNLYIWEIPWITLTCGFLCFKDLLYKKMISKPTIIAHTFRLDQIIARMTTTTNKPLISSTTTSKSDVHLHLNANVILLAFTCVGILLLFTVTVLIYLCFTKTSPNSKNSDCWGRTRSVSNYPRRKQLVHNNITKLGFNDNLLYDVVNAGTTS